MDIEHYKKMLATHDWFYEFSDDSGVYRIGEESEKTLRDLAESDKELKRLYQEAVEKFNNRIRKA